MPLRLAITSLCFLFLPAAALAQTDFREHPLLTWIKRHPQPVAKASSPRMGYEGAYGYDPLRKLLIRYGGHNQGGGGEQNSEVWTYDLDRDLWKLMQPNHAPPGVCCAQQNVFHDAAGRFVRFPAFSNSHGWQSAREVALNNTSVWTFDAGANHWTNRRPLPEPPIRPLRGAAYDPRHEVIVVHGGEGAKHSTVVYDLHTNTWHKMHPKKAPPAGISQPGFTYDEKNRVFVLFGSQFQTDPRTWTYDLHKNRWQVLRTTGHPPAEKSSPILAADTRNGIVLCSVRGKDGLETWALDVPKATWKKLAVTYKPRPSAGSAGNRNRVLLYLPDRNLFVMENRVRSEQQIWTFRYADAPARLPAPRDLKATIQADGKSVIVSRKAPRKKGPFRYLLERGCGKRAWEVEWKEIAGPLDATSFTDKIVTRGEIAWYRTRIVVPNNETVPYSNLARTQPPVVEELVVSVVDAKRVELQWKPLPHTDVIGYHVERAPVMVYSTDQVKSIKRRLEPTSDKAVGVIRRIGAFERLTKKPIEKTDFVDTQIDLDAGQARDVKAPILRRDLRPDQRVDSGKPYRYAVYAYRIRAVNRFGITSGPSPARFTIPAPVQFVFSKEEGKAATRLKWAKSPEKNLQGYLIYRHNGRFNNSKIVRLTTKSLSEPTFLDKKAGKSTRRYEIIAVDALGQEGVPSRPVWSRREWQRFYVPYTKGWHL